MIARILAIAAIEMRIALRNRWVVTAIALMTGFGLILAFAGSAPAGTLGVDRLTVTVTSLATLSVYLVPLIALLLSYDAFAGESERGTLPLLLTYPVARWQILAGKFGAQLAVLAAAILIGFGVTGLAVWATGGASAESVVHLVRLQWSAIVLGAAFLALGNCLSASVRQAGTAASLAIAVWLLAVVMFDVALLGAVVADDGGLFTKTIFPWLLVISPTDAFRLFNLLAVDGGGLSGGSGLAGATGGFALPALAPVISLVAWPLVLLAAAGAVLRRFEP